MSVRIVLFSSIILAYLYWTIRFSIHFYRRKDFSGRLKAFHILMAWLVPFIWILLLNALFKPTSGSHRYADKKNPDSLAESGLGVWMDSSTGEV
jgi:hypothetical protein